MQKSAEAQGTCFVVMPFSVKEHEKTKYEEGHWKEVYQGLIVPAVERAGLHCERDDEDVGARLITEGVLDKLERASVVLCDLSSHNPNVFLELGWAMRADRPFVLIKDDLTQPTFDLSHAYTFEYSHSLKPISLKAQIPALAGVLNQTLSDKARRYSLVRRLSLSLSAIQAYEREDAQAQMIAEIHDRVRHLQDTAWDLLKPNLTFPWPQLLSRAMALLFDARKEVAALPRPDATSIERALDSLCRSHLAQRSPDIQLSLLDEQGTLLYHDWKPMIGTPAMVPGTDATRVLDEILARPFGVVSWIDNATNVSWLADAQKHRLNIAVFSALEDSRWRVVVETHYELRDITARRASEA